MAQVRTAVRSAAFSFVLLAGGIGSTIAPTSAEIFKAGDLSVTGNVAGTTDYVFRGVSQTKRDFAGQANLDATYKFFYAGMFVSNVDFGRDAGGALVTDKVKGSSKVASVEIDYYAGFKIPVGKKLELDIGGIFYTYPNAFDGSGRLFEELNYVEGKLGATYKVTDAFTLTAVAFGSPQYTNKTGRVYTFEGSASYALPKFGSVDTAISALIGVQTGNSDRFKAFVTNGRDSYVYWNAGATFTFAERFSIDVRYWNTNIKDNNATSGFSDRFCTGVILQCDQSVSATAKVTF
jgi:uncharacterized protein (TIGR02001 family)